VVSYLNKGATLLFLTLANRSYSCYTVVLFWIVTLVP
jgi:hypothetical protein